MTSAARAGTGQRGFTLIEILLVIIVIGVVMGTVVLSLNPADASRRLQVEREQLQGELQLARSIAESDHADLGLRLAPESLTYYRFSPRDRQWRAITSEAALKPRKVPGIDFSWRDDAATGNAPPTPRMSELQPDLLLLSSGEATPGTIILRARDDDRAPALELVLSDIGEVYPRETGSASARVGGKR